MRPSSVCVSLSRHGQRRCFMTADFLGVLRVDYEKVLVINLSHDASDITVRRSVPTAAAAF